MFTPSLIPLMITFIACTAAMAMMVRLVDKRLNPRLAVARRR